MQILSSLAGMVVILAIAVLLSSNRRAIKFRVVGAAFALQASLAALVLYVPWGKTVLQVMSNGVSNLLGYAQAGTNFIFGPLASPEIGGNSFAIAALPVIIFFASLISILYYLGIMQYIIRWIGGGLQKVTGISKVESLCAAANIFVGQSESPLVIRPYLAGLKPEQLFCVMTVGMAGVAGTILAAYASMGTDPHRLSARRRLHVRAGRHPDGQAHDARRAANAADRGGPKIAQSASCAAERERRARHGARRWRGKAREHHHGRSPGRADRRQAGGRSGRDGAGLRRLLRSPTVYWAASAVGSGSLI